MNPARRLPTVLLADDDEKFAGVLRNEIERMGYNVLRAASGGAALEALARVEADVVLLDLRLGDADGLQILQRIRESGSAAVVIVLTGHGTVESAIAAMKLGAFDFITKPCKLSELEALLAKACEAYRVQEENRGLREYLAAAPQPVLTEDPEMLRLLASLERVARSDAPVLVLGESGTGKELIAREIHRRGADPERPFVAVNCAVLQEQLLESELFGHEKGAFTGAARRKLGLFDLADGGTIFLDEVGEIDESLQAKLLRVLQFGEFRRVGGNQTLKVQVRVIAATNLDLERAVREGHFRQDLFFRLNVVPLKLPPLRERRGDVALLARHFLKLYGGKRPWKLEEGALAALARYAWPGNVRELENIVRRLVIFHDPESVDAAAIHALLPGPPAAAAADEPLLLEEIEKRHILKVLAQRQGDKRAAAEALGIAVKTLYNKLHSYGWKPEGA